MTTTEILTAPARHVTAACYMPHGGRFTGWLPAGAYAVVGLCREDGAAAYKLECHDGNRYVGTWYVTPGQLSLLRIASANVEADLVTAAIINSDQEDDYGPEWNTAAAKREALLGALEAARDAVQRMDHRDAFVALDRARAIVLGM